MENLPNDEKVSAEASTDNTIEKASDFSPERWQGLTEKMVEELEHVLSGKPAEISIMTLVEEDYQKMYPRNWDKLLSQVIELRKQNSQQSL